MQGLSDAGAPRIDVSVVVPCYNVARYLDQCLTSLERNDRARIEIIALNDGSTDDTLAIMRSHEARDGRVRVIDKPNQGYGATVNRGIDEARGRYVAVAEPDDFVEPHMYDDLADLAAAHGFPDVVKSSYWRIITAGARDIRAHCWYYRRGRAPRGTFRIGAYPCLLQYHPSIWSALYRRDFLIKRGIRFIEAPGGGWVDNPFLVEALLRADSIAYTEDAYYCYREDLSEASSAHMDPAVMIERWNQRQDLVDRWAPGDAGIARAQVCVGLSFAEDILRQAPLPAGTETALTAMLARMGAGPISQCEDVSPSIRRRCLQLLGVAGPARLLGYRMSLARRLIWALRYNGLRFVISQIF